MAVLVIGFIFFGKVISGVETVGILPNWTVPGEQFVVYVFNYALYTFLPLGLLVNRVTKTNNVIEKQQIKYILFGAAMSLLAGWTAFLPGFGVKIEPYGLFFIFIFQFMVGFAILKYQMFDIKQTLSRFGALVVAIFIYGFVGSIISYFYAVIVGTNFYTIILLVSQGILFGIPFSKIVSILQTYTEKKFLRGYYDSEKVMREINKSLVMVGDKIELLRMLVRVLTLEMELGGVAALIKTNKNGADFYVFKSFQEEQDIGRDQFVLISRSFEEMKASKELITGKDWASEQIAAISPFYGVLPNTVIVPLTSHERCEAILFVQGKLSQESLNQKDLDVLDAILHECMIVFDRIIKTEELEKMNRFLEDRVKEEVAKSEKALDVAQELASQALFSQVTKGIAHEIRNPIEAIRGSAEDMEAYFIFEPGESAELTSQDIPADVLNRLVEAGYVDEQGVPSTSKLVLGAQPLVVPDMDPEVLGPVSSVLKSKQRKRMLQACCSVIVSESERIVRIADEMVKFGTSGQGLPKDCFSELISAIPSEEIWGYLKSKQFITAKGYIVPAVLDRGVVLEAPYEAFSVEIMSVLKTFKSAQLQVVDVVQLVEQFQHLHGRFLSSKGIDFSVMFLAIEGATVLSREDELMRCLMNVVKNAEEACLQKQEVGGCIKISVSIDFSEAQHEGVVVLSVTDNGVGISESHVQTVKEAFFTTKDPAGGKHVGLGLAFVNRMIESYAGTLTLSSVLGEGTTVTLRLPRCP